MGKKDQNKYDSFNLSPDSNDDSRNALTNGAGAKKSNRREINNKHDRLDDFFKKIEIAKKEWEKTMDCVGDMIILTDSDGIIKRINRSVREFTNKTYEEILGRTWEDVITDHELEAMTLFSGCTELRHRPTGRWFELTAYPVNDSELEFSGNVLTIHETTEVKNITEKLEKSNKKIERERKKIQNTLSEICYLMQNVIQMKDINVRFSNPHLVRCYEMKNCDKKDCVCYGKEAMRCWQVAGTFCDGEVQGAFAHKYRNCTECEVYKHATSDPVFQIGEHFNNMMHVLSLKNIRS
ncbi:MAG: PAS domain S-box protein [Nitrospirota bacterium]